MKEGCRNWLLRSPETTEFNLLDVAGQWQVWTGVIEKAEITVKKNVCSDESDCNMNGQCKDGKCICDEEDGVTFMGEHCEVVLRDECRTLVGGEEFIVSFYTTDDSHSNPILPHRGK